jgi:diguanylate cyclase (GGDEF)-like protein/PAS domain S-box-containing protein
MMKRPPSRWLLLPVLLLMVTGLCERVIALRGQADECRQLQLLLARGSSLVSRLESLEMEVLYGSAEQRPNAHRELQSTRAEFLAVAEALTRYRWAHLDAATLVESGNRYAAAVDREISLLGERDIQAAAEVDNAEVDPACKRLMRAMQEVDRRASVLAEKRIRKANLMLVSLCIVFSAAITGVLVADDRLRRRLLAHEHDALQKRERYFRRLTEDAFDTVLIVAPDQTIRYATPSVAGIFGVNADEVRDRPLLNFVFPEDRAYVSEHLCVTGSIHATRLEFRLASGDDIRFVEAALRDLRSDPEMQGLVLNLRDIDSQKRAQSELLHNALHDNLTSLPNRVMFTERLESALDHARRSANWSVGLLFVDVDDFKTINDSLGHWAGDAVIVEVAQRITKSLRNSDVVARHTAPGPIVARVGGDEFTVMVDGIYDPADAVRVCERIHAAMRLPIDVAGQPIYATVSIGVALSDNASTAQELMRNADMAMYRAKSGGKARYALFDREMHERATSRLKLETDLRVALENDEFVLHYQPIVDLTSGRIRRVEALIRWRRGTSNVLTMPGAFVPVAEESGLIRSIGDWVLRRATLQGALWNQGSAEPVIVCVNVSGKQFTHTGFIDEVTSALADSGLAPECLELEITEGVAMDDAQLTQRVIGQLRGIGVRLALDDFGTGYSSFSYLRRFSVNTLKIDRSFICDIPTNTENVAIVQTIIKLAGILGLDVVAEGIETPEQLSTLQAAGCALAQGFLLMKPQAANAPPWPADVHVGGFRQSNKQLAQVGHDELQTIVREFGTAMPYLQSTPCLPEWQVVK